MEQSSDKYVYTNQAGVMDPVPQYPASPQTVVITQPIQPIGVAVGAKPRWSWSVTITALFGMVFCSTGWLCSFLGLIQAIHAYVDHKTGDYRHAEGKRKCAWGFTIAGIVIGSLVWIIIIILIVTGAIYASSATQQAMRNYNNNYN